MSPGVLEPMLSIRVRIRTIMIAMPALAVLEVFLRPEANRDPVFLSATYGALIVAGLVQLLIYAIGFLDLSGPIPREGRSLKPGRRDRTKAMRPAARGLRTGWRTINARRYYYKSEREGSRVETTYFVVGKSGLLIARLRPEDKERRGARSSAGSECPNPCVPI